MTASTDVSFPTYKALSIWQKHLRRHRPHGLWVRQLMLHRVEAQVDLSDIPPLDQLDRLVLEALAGNPVTQSTTLAERFQLTVGTLQPFLLALQQSGLVTKEPGGWGLTEQGKSCAEQNRVPPVTQRRQTFYFEEPENEGDSHRYLALNKPLTEPRETEVDQHFDVRLLENCLAESTEWKKARGFPPRAQSLCKATSTEIASTQPDEVWSRLIVVRPEQAHVLLAVCPAGRDREQLLGFNVQTDNWHLRHQNPSLQLGEDWSDVFPELKKPPEEEDWKNGWQDWGRTQGLAPHLLEECEIHPREHQLQIRAPEAVIGLIKKSRREALRGDSWILVGTGYLRRVVQLHITALPESDSESESDG